MNWDEEALEDVNEPAMAEYDDSTEHPSPEQLMIREALKTLTPHQKRIWNRYAYDRWTEDEIAENLKVNQKSIHVQIKNIEKKVKKWCELNRGAYMLLKMEQRIVRGDA